PLSWCDPMGLQALPKPWYPPLQKPPFQDPFTPWKPTFVPMPRPVPWWVKPLPLSLGMCASILIDAAPTAEPGADAFPPPDKKRRCKQVHPRWPNPANLWYNYYTTDSGCQSAIRNAFQSVKNLTRIS